MTKLLKGLLCAWAVLAAGPVAAADPTDAKTVDELIARATKANAELNTIASAVAKVKGCKVSMGPIKKKERIIEKAHNDYKDDFNKVVDVCRTTVVCDKNADTVATGAVMGAEGSVFKTGAASAKVWRAKDRWNTPTDLHYRDFLFNVQMTSQANCEIQISSAPMVAAKKGEGHKHYETIRTTATKPEPGKDDGPDEVEDFWTAIHGSMVVYDKAFEAGK